MGGKAGQVDMGQRVHVCVFCASSDNLQPHYLDAARELARGMAFHHMSLVYGGGNNGLMGALSNELHECGGTVIGVIPERLRGLGYAFDDADELVVTDGMRERKAVMEERADGFLCLPGGFGTLEEVLEIITLRQLRFHDKPIVILNLKGFYDKLLDQFERAYEESFVAGTNRSLYHVVNDVDTALDYIRQSICGVRDQSL